MVIISEFLSNPKGKDTEGEWVELYNNSTSSVNITGYKLKDLSGKTFIFQKIILTPNEYRAFDYKTTKISLNNRNETISLYDSKDELIDSMGFTGTAPEGQSLVRRENNAIFVDNPTPGKTNTLEISKKIDETRFQTVEPGSALVSINSASLGIIFTGFFVSLALGALFFYVYKKLKS